MTELRKAKELDPLSPMIGCDLADGYLHAGRLQQADAELRRVLDLYPDFLPAHRYRISLLTRQGNLAMAETEAQVYWQKSGDKMPLEAISIFRLARAGKAEEARSALRRLLDRPSGSQLNAYSAAQLYFITGQTEQGYAALEKTYRQRSWWLVTMLVDPGFDPVRTQPRFIDLAQRVGLPVDEDVEQAFRDSGPRLK